MDGPRLPEDLACMAI